MSCLPPRRSVLLPPSFTTDKQPEAKLLFLVKSGVGIKYLEAQGDSSQDYQVE